MGSGFFFARFAPAATAAFPSSNQASSVFIHSALSPRHHPIRASANIWEVGQLLLFTTIGEFAQFHPICRPAVMGLDKALLSLWGIATIAEANTMVL
jgi:hypothetical protein